MAGTTYQAADGTVADLVQRVMREHHPALADTGVTVSVVMAAKETEEEGAVPALKRNGLDIAAKIQVASLVDRARGLPDTKLTVDQFAWDRLAERSRIALIDHELEHLQLVGETDDLGRPKLKLRPHDWELTGFARVVERHGEAALESQQVARFRADFAEQLSLWR